MTSHSPADTPETEREPQRQPGRDLAAARERAEISQDEMAVRLRLRQSQLDAIERDDYATLPPPTFVRGYLRAYARELGLEPEAFVAAYAARIASDGTPDSLTRAGMEHTHGNGPGVWVGLLLIVLVVGGGAGAWWYQHRMPAGEGTATEEAANAGSDASVEADSDTADAGMPTDKEARDDQAASEQVAPEQAAPEQPASEQAGDTDADTTDSQNAGTDLQQNDTESAVVANENDTDNGSMGSATDSKTQTTGSETATTSAEGADSAGNTDSGNTGSGNADSTAAAAGPARLVLSFDGRSWVEVRDAGGRKLAYTLYHDSAPLKLRGEPPFSIYLGNARAVQVRMNGESVDMQPFIQGNNTARVVVDESGAHAR